jgi:hypothetical protein
MNACDVIVIGGAHSRALSSKTLRGKVVLVSSWL